MVFTHIPSSLLLITIPWAPNFSVAAALFVLRESLVEMDVPTRQSYTMAVVRPAERTTAAGITNLVRLAGWAVGPAFAGALMQGGALGGPLYAGAAMKIAYDLLLYRAFRHLPPPEEREPAREGAC
jgi:predicted MFS family arabinose efflux permease